MSIGLSERRTLLDQTVLLTIADIEAFWSAMSRDESVSNNEFRAIITEAFPEIVDPYAAIASELATDWYQQSAPDLDFVAVPGELPDRERLRGSARWSLGAFGDDALGRLAGAAQRAVWNTARATITNNVTREPGARWARIAQPDACAFCAMLSTRSEKWLYTSADSAMTVGASAPGFRHTAAGAQRRGAGGRIRGTRKPGQEYHDNCRCQAVEVRPGQSLTLPDHAQRFDDAYIEASKKHSTTEGILAEMRVILGSH